MSFNGEPPIDHPAFEINVNHLIFNQHNGRIGTFVKTYEKQYGTIQAHTEEGEAVIREFLWNSKRTRNKETLADIKENGQMEVGIVTRDGVVIDGNRRCMLLKKIAAERHTSPTYFRAVILNSTLETNPQEIRRLETIYQMGVDEKVDYNPIEKYLKCEDLKVDFAEEEIAKMMGEDVSDIRKYLGILKLMKEYLRRIDKDYVDMYTVLGEEKVEGPFVDLIGYLDKHETGRRMNDRDWSPEKDDIDDLKNIYFDYIRAGFRTAHGIRNIGNPSKGQGFFNRKELWKEFIDDHEEKVEAIEEKDLNEYKEERPDEDLEKIIKAKDDDWGVQVKPMMKANIGRTKRMLDDQNAADSPMELLQRARNTLNSINMDNESIEGEEIRSVSHEIRKIAENIIKVVDNKAKN
jgi:hypothetical protein